MTDRELGFHPVHAIVTGSDSGIGRATAVALARAGMDVGIPFHTDAAGAQGTAQEVETAGRRAVVARLDSSDLVGTQRIVAEMAGQLGGLDVFVNNAGTGSATPLLRLGLAEWRQVVATDLDGAFAGIQAAARLMVAAGASLVVDGGMLQMGPQAGAHIVSDDWRSSAD